jgi:hypothetical protein
MNLADDYAKVGDPRHVDALATALELAPELRTSLGPSNIAALRSDRRHAKLVARLELK